MDASPDPAQMRRTFRRTRLGLPVMATAAALVLTSCGPRNTDEILRGGVPANTNLPDATTLPPEAIRTVARRDFGWRLIYHPGSAPPNADGRAAAALCGLESRRVARVAPAPLTYPTDDPGTRMIDIFCA
ncbi:hypothetical protein [Paracoccus sp. SCSIO 75233]|uniref:hypothetical protein n=1 Tax=Paracoccus sp. SCSIO 75233 TaxID=3017782 RepID=UPI0022F0C485|nr:hypothetical protein [Paracoccus sp. SCSIO 75233]WBU52292.1 hypothetical protein PAF12_10655 [Paracoccus sp. SCSIO 75233]